MDVRRRRNRPHAHSQNWREINMGEMIATREAFGRALAACGAENRDIVVLDADLSKATMSSVFQKAFPERFFNVGIAEGDLIDTAAGLAAAGKIPFACTFAVFAAGRAFEQIRNSVAYPKLNVKICGSHGGIAVGWDGATHQAVEDLAIMAAIPNMVVLYPGDAVEMEAAVKAMALYDGPVYIRFGRQPQPVLFDRSSYEFRIGKGIVMRKGRDVTLVVTGSLLAAAMQAADDLAAGGIEAEVLHLPTIKPLDEALLVESASRTGRAVVIEEGVIRGGLGSAVAVTLAQHCPVPMGFVGMEDTFGQSGSPEELLEYYHLTPAAVVERVKGLMK